jgi:hypothetical protein
MAKKDVYNTIIVSQEPRGRRAVCVVSGTPKPGTVMQLKAATEPIGGRHTWEVFNGAADGERTVIAVLLEDSLQGKGITDAYVDGSRGFLYFPLPGDELLMQLLDVAGTADTRAIGDKYMADDGTGLLVVTTGSPEAEQFVLLETLAAPTADTHAHVMFSGY